jgi:ATP-dependent protease HslVU (ClpYQ) peptidase subunit
MGYNTKNYTEQGGEKTVIGGELAIAADGKVTFDGAELKPAAVQVDSVAEDVATLLVDFNGLLAKLKAAGLMESE